MDRQGDETHLETDKARGAESTGVMRWVLGISLLLAIGLLSAIWIFGAWNQDEVGRQATVNGAPAAAETGAGDANSIVSPDQGETGTANDQ